MKRVIVNLLIVALMTVHVVAQNFQAGETVVITQDIAVNTSYEIPAGVTLVFQGGKITGSGTLRGNKTSIVAPIAQIFGDNLKVEGSWSIDRAYPQWFGAITYDTPRDYSKSSTAADAGVAINKAVTMKGMGEVFLPQGIYVLITPIYLPLGITLTGERGMDPLTSTSSNNYKATVLQSWKSNQSTAVDDGNNMALIYVNKDSSGNYITQGGFLGGQITRVSNLCLFNYMPTNLGNSPDLAELLKKSTTACYKGIYAAESVIIDNVRFSNFRQAVLFDSERYTDCKKIVNCDYVCAVSSFSKLDKLYAFDLRGLGDALIFEHNAVHDGNYNQGLILQDCGGGKISANILNADVEMWSSKGVTFNDNHMENGHQVRIITSSVSTHNNFFEKGYVPSYSIMGNQYNHRSMVSMSGDQFFFYDFPRDYPEGKETGTTDMVTRIQNSCDYDIILDKNAIVNIDNTYRWLMPNALFGTSYNYGVLIGKNESEPLADFNDYSYMLSQHGTISAGFKVEKEFTLSNLNAPVVNPVMKNGTVPWLISNGTYKYSYQILWDKQRKILGTKNGSQMFDISSYGSGSISSDNSLQLNDGQCALIVLDSAEPVGGKTMIRLYRIKMKDDGSGADPSSIMCGAACFYDNGLSVCGYKWQPATMPLAGVTGVESLTYHDENVDCRIANNTPGQSWKHGDVLYNTLLNSSWDLKIVK